MEHETTPSSPEVPRLPSSEFVVAASAPRDPGPAPSTGMATLVCAFRVPRAIFDETIALYFSRDEGVDRLWALLKIEDEIDEILHLGSKVTVSRLHALCKASDVDMWCAVHGPSAGTSRTSSFAMVGSLVRAWDGISQHASPLHEGLLTWADIRRIVAPIERAAAIGDLEGKLFRGAPIIKLAAELGLSPSHSGGSPWAWLCLCPGTSHQLMINAQSGEWGCGYCCRKGGALALAEFAREPRRDDYWCRLREDVMEVLMSGEMSSMVSTWTVYLCLEKVDGQVILSNCQYEALAELHEYEVETEEGDTEYSLPEFIDGKAVVGIDDDFVVGGELGYWDAGMIPLQPGDTDGARAWLTEHYWDQQPGFEEAWAKIQEALRR